MRRIGAAAVTRRLQRTSPSGFRELELRLAPGRYRLWCTLGDHRAGGLVALLVVRR